MVRNTVLPNPQTYSDKELGKWRDVNLRIKPLELILAVLDRLGRNYGIAASYIKPNELIKILIPLAGNNSDVDLCTEALIAYRKGKLDLSDWPNCAPGANDKRLAREFLLFLENFDICQTDNSTNKYEQKFFLDQVLGNEIHPDTERSFLENVNIIEDEVSNSRDSEIQIIIERKRVASNVIRRTRQPRFRKDVLKASENRCILTNEMIPDVLEAAHIVPVSHGGTDLVGNGFCMRVDIHRLYDAGKIRIEPDGNVRLGEQVNSAASYSSLPKGTILPTSVNVANLEWRNRYL